MREGPNRRREEDARVLRHRAPPPARPSQQGRMSPGSRVSHIVALLPYFPYARVRARVCSNRLSRDNVRHVGQRDGHARSPAPRRRHGRAQKWACRFAPAWSSWEPSARSASLSCALLEKHQRALVHLARAEAIKRPPEDTLVSAVCARKERHRGAELKVVRRAEDLAEKSPLDG